MNKEHLQSKSEWGMRLDQSKVNNFLLDIIAAINAERKAEFSVYRNNYDDQERVYGLYLDADKECTAHISYNEQKHRISFRISSVASKMKTESGCSERFSASSNLYPRPADPDVTVSADKTPEQIAKDFFRRFYFPAQEIYTQLLVARDEYDNRVRATQEVAKRVASALNTRIEKSNLNRISLTIWGNGVDADVSADEVKIKAGLHSEDALEVINLIQKLRKARKS
jgi:hypothetical protein